MPKTKKFTKYHNDGTLWAKGQHLDGEMHGYWEWYRKSGVIMRSGYFENGKQTGEWTTYDQKGKIYKVTKMKEPKTTKVTDGAKCNVIAGTHKGKSGKVADINISKTGHMTITVVQKSGVRFKTLAKNVEVVKK